MPNPSPRCADTKASHDLYSRISSRLSVNSLMYSIRGPQLHPGDRVAKRRVAGRRAVVLDDQRDVVVRAEGLLKRRDDRQGVVPLEVVRVGDGQKAERRARSAAEPRPRRSPWNTRDARRGMSPSGTPTCCSTDLAELAQRQFLVAVLPKALQPEVPRLCARLAEQVVDDEELQVDVACELEVQVTRPVMRPLDLHAADRPPLTIDGPDGVEPRPTTSARACALPLTKTGTPRSFSASASSALIHVSALP